jgi:hypothetical protein
VCPAAPLAFSQFETAEVLGTVRDPSQAAIAKASVTLTNQSTGAEGKTTIDENGDYDFFNVKVGTYYRYRAILLETDTSEHG